MKYPKVMNILKNHNYLFLLHRYEVQYDEEHFPTPFGIEKLASNKHPKKAHLPISVEP